MNGNNDHTAKMYRPIQVHFVFVSALVIRHHFFCCSPYMRYKRTQNHGKFTLKTVILIINLCINYYYISLAKSKAIYNAMYLFYTHENITCKYRTELRVKMAVLKSIQKYYYLFTSDWHHVKRYSTACEKE